MKVAIYTRVSSAKQSTEGSSLETQLERCEAYCRERGYDVAAVFREVKSGALLWERVELTRLRESVARREIDAVVVHGYDRFARDQKFQDLLLVEFARYGVRVESVTEPLDDSWQGDLTRTLLGKLAEYDRMKRTEATQRGHRHRQSKGHLRGTHKAL